MNPYGDRSSPSGRAQVPGASGDPGRAADDAYRSTGHKPAGGGWAGKGGSPRPSAPSGRARVGAPASDGGYGQPSGRPGAGRASVGSASVAGAGAAGRATVGRAVVSPPGPGGSGPDGPDGRRGRGGKDDPAARAKAKRRRRINWIVASFAVFVMLTGGGVVGLSYYSAKVVLPNDVPLPLSTTIYAKDSKTALVKLGEENRQFVTKDQIPEYVQHAVAAAEDRNFYRHSGVDYAGIARAAWNNFTGGERQGASTITQQYARNAYANLDSDTYARKVKEAVMASKLNDKYDKPTIMQHYLNTIYFGRGAYGIQAAAQAYFHTNVDKLTVAQAAVLAAVIKQPVPSPTHKGYDPANNLEAAKDRWTYVLDGMVEEKWLDTAQRPTEYPAFDKPKDGENGALSVKTPRGNVVNYVRDEMKQMKLCVDGPRTNPESCSAKLADGGYKITTTIDPKLQDAAESAAQHSRKGSELNDQPTNLMAALVAIDPTNGQVRAYYGGDDGTGFDYAGKNDSDGTLTGGHPAGSSFKVYTLSAALNAGISIDSHWDANEFKPEGFAQPITNAGRDVKKTCNAWCSLQYSTEQSYNVPFFHVTETIGPAAVVDMAKAAGITTMWTTPSRGPSVAVDLTTKKGSEVAPSEFDRVVGYGQYPITVLDHANGIATLANHGVYNKAHFIVKIEQQDQKKGTGKWELVGGEHLKPQQRVKPSVANEVTSVLKAIPGINHHALGSGREAAGKTGTWQYGDTSDNAHAWMVGYTPQLATAVWVGSQDAKKPQILDKSGTSIGGGKLPADVWKRFMDAALKGTKEIKLPDPAHIGDPSVGDGKSPQPQQQQQQQNPGCANPLDVFCQNPGRNPTPGAGGQGGGLPPTPRLRQ